MTESWALIPDSTRYEVSDLGNVRSVTHTVTASNGIPRTIKGKPIARLTTENGSPYVSIRRDDSPGFMTEVGPTQHPARKGEPAATWLVIRWAHNTEKAS